MKKILLILFLYTVAGGFLMANGKKEYALSPLDEFQSAFSNIPLELNKAPYLDEKISTYYDFYNVNIKNCAHYFGYFLSRGQKISAHIYLPSGAEKTVFLVHGYLLHSASYYHLIKKLVDAGYGVAAFDLPGHGFSSGNSGDISDFGDYAMVLKDFIDFTTPNLPEIHGIIGLSTGSSVIIEFCRLYATPFSRHILGAPLIRSDKWKLSRFGNKLIKGFIKSVNTLERDTTSNKEAKKFVQKQDPLKIKKVPLSWVQALYRWHDLLHHQDSSISGDFLILQGDKDVVVEWRYNIPFLEEKLKHPDVKIIPGGKHELYLEADELREEIFTHILNYLES